MTDSILETVKKVLGIEKDDQFFDNDLIIHTNSALFTMYQIGVGQKPFTITGSLEKWGECVTTQELCNIVKAYIPMKVRIAFDPPQSSAVSEALKNYVSEMEFRISIAVDSADTNVTGGSNV